MIRFRRGAALSTTHDNDNARWEFGATDEEDAFRVDSTGLALTSGTPSLAGGFLFCLIRPGVFRFGAASRVLRRFAVLRIGAERSSPNDFPLKKTTTALTTPLGHANDHGNALWKIVLSCGRALVLSRPGARFRAAPPEGSAALNDTSGTRAALGGQLFCAGQWAF